MQFQSISSLLIVDSIRSTLIQILWFFGPWIIEEFFNHPRVCWIIVRIEPVTSLPGFAQIIEHHIKMAQLEYPALKACNSSCRVDCIHNLPSVQYDRRKIFADMVNVEILLFLWNGIERVLPQLLTGFHIQWAILEGKVDSSFHVPVNGLNWVRCEESDSTEVLKLSEKTYQTISANIVGVIGGRPY